MADAGIELANQMQPGETPLPAKAPPYKGGAWTYGSVPPELD